MRTCSPHYQPEIELRVRSLLVRKPGKVGRDYPLTLDAIVLPLSTDGALEAQRVVVGDPIAAVIVHEDVRATVDANALFDIFVFHALISANTGPPGLEPARAGDTERSADG